MILVAIYYLTLANYGSNLKWISGLHTLSSLSCSLPYCALSNQFSKHYKPGKYLQTWKLSEAKDWAYPNHEADPQVQLCPLPGLTDFVSGAAAQLTTEIGVKKLGISCRAGESCIWGGQGSCKATWRCLSNLEEHKISSFVCYPSLSSSPVHLPFRGIIPNTPVSKPGGQATRGKKFVLPTLLFARGTCWQAHSWISHIPGLSFSCNITFSFCFQGMGMVPPAQPTSACCKPVLHTKTQVDEA